MYLYHIKLLNQNNPSLIFYINECFKSENKIGPTQKVLRILGAKHKNSELNKVITKQCYSYLKNTEKDT